MELYTWRIAPLVSVCKKVVGKKGGRMTEGEYLVAKMKTKDTGLYDSNHVFMVRNSLMSMRSDKNKIDSK